MGITPPLNTRSLSLPLHSNIQTQSLVLSLLQYLEWSKVCQVLLSLSTFLALWELWVCMCAHKYAGAFALQARGWCLCVLYCSSPYLLIYFWGRPSHWVKFLTSSQISRFLVSSAPPPSTHTQSTGITGIGHCSWLFMLVLGMWI